MEGEVEGLSGRKKVSTQNYPRALLHLLTEGVTWYTTSLSSCIIQVGKYKIIDPGKINQIHLGYCGHIPGRRTGRTKEETIYLNTEDSINNNILLPNFRQSD